MGLLYLYLYSASYFILMNDMNRDSTAFLKLQGSQPQVQNSGMRIPLRQTTLFLFSGKAVNSALNSPVLVFLSTEFGMRTCCHPLSFQQTAHADRRNSSLLNCTDYN